MKREVKWGSPKHLQNPTPEKAIIAEQLEEPHYDTLIVDGKPMEVLPEVQTKRPKHNKKYCKFLKGPHQYSEYRAMKYSFAPTKPTGIWERYCIKCQRHDTWYAPTIPGEYFNRDLTARPPENA